MNFKTYTYKELDSIIFELKNNKAVVIPTDTIIGVMAKNTNIIYKVKRRPKDKKIVTFISDINDIPNLTYLDKKFLDKFWPGQVTIIKNGVSYRMPDDKYILYILSKTGPLYASSANLSGEQVISNTSEANKIFDKENLFYDVVLVEGETKTNQASSIVDLDNFKIIREGHHIEEIKEFIKKMLSERKKVVFLSDDIEYSSNLIKNMSDENLQLVDKPLSKLSFSSACTEVLKNPELIVFIVTKNPVFWDAEANKQHQIRAGILYDENVAQLSKQHDDTNIAILDTNNFAFDTILKYAKIYTNATFEGGRHIKRIQTITDYEVNKK